MNHYYPSSFRLRLAVLVGTVGIAVATASGQTPPDNTKANKGDTDSSAVTADKQKMNATDQTLTQQIRKAVMADKSLSTYATTSRSSAKTGR